MSLVGAGMEYSSPQGVRDIGKVAGGEQGAGVQTVQVRQTEQRPALRQQVHRHKLLLRQDQQAVRLINVWTDNVHWNSTSRNW